MKLQRLSIERLAGIDHPFELEELGNGLNIIVGPNGIGKSRICTAVRALLWHERGVSSDGLTARADFDHEGTHWQVVRDGSLHRWQRDGIDAIPPRLPGERLDACFFLGLRDLLDDSDHAGRDLASEIRRQMSGGFDLDAVQRRFEGAAPAHVGRKESKALVAAEQEIRKAERVQVELEQRERELESLESRAAEAERAFQRLTAFATAISLQGLRADHAQRKSELGELPDSLANLDGKEIQRLDKLEESLVQKRGEREAADNALEDSREAARQTRLDTPIDAAWLATWHLRAEKLGELERRIEEARVAAAGAREVARLSRQSLGAHAPSDAEFGLELEPALAIEDDFDLFAFLRDSQRLASKREAVTERLRLLTAREFSDEDSRRLELLKRGVEPLRRWLRAPDPDLQTSAEERRPSHNNLIVVGVALVAIGLTVQTMQFFASLVPYSPIAVGTGIGLAVAGVFLRQITRRAARTSARTADSTDWRSIAAKQFPESLDPPSDWSADSVEACLGRLEDELTKHDASEKRARDRAVERGQLEENLNGLERREGDLKVRREVLFARLGLDSMRPDAELVDLARALDASRAAHVEARRATATLEEFEEQHSQLLEGIAAVLKELGEGEPIDGSSARAGVHSLERRDRALRGATADGIREEKGRERLDREIDRLEADKAEIFRIAAIDANDRAELTQLLSHLSRYRGLTLEISKLAGGFERAESDLDAAGEAALAGSSVAKLQEERTVLERKSEERKDLDRQIVEIRLHARIAREGHLLEDAIARKSAAMSELRDRRDEALAALTGQSLVDSVRREHETNQMPRVLERARNRFAAFTHHRYELKVSPRDGGSFVAVDAKSGEGLSLDKLSDGTRAQLILAARLAFAEEAEQGADLPLFLDEAMDHSDPERFHAIAGSLARMVVEEGRQIFYLSNDPTDIERFQSAFDEAGCDELKTWDLAEIRGQAASVDRRAALRVAALAVVPRPEDQDAESYGVAIGVSPLEPSRDPFGQHLYYVLRDDLSLLHEFLEARIESVGQCRNLLKGGSALAKSIATRAEVGAGLEARIELLEIFCLAWREGRGVRVGRSEIEESDKVTEKYLDVVVELVTALDGDARQLIASLRERKDSRLSGYRRKSTDELERFFVEHGQIDDKPILSEAEIIERAVGTPASNQLSPKVAAELVHQWWRLSDQARIRKD
jgi:DNA repair exonuclease SbcCD ATPase subunit